MRSAGKTRMIHGARHPTLAQEMATTVKAKFVAQKSVHVGWTPSLGPKIPDGPALPSQCMLFHHVQAARGHQNAGNPVVIHPVFLIPLLAYA